MIFFKPFIKWKKEMETKSSDKWMADCPNDDITVTSDSNKRIVNSKFTGTSLPHLPINDYFEMKENNIEYEVYNHGKSLNTDDYQTRPNTTIRSNSDDKRNRKTTDHRTKSTPRQYDSKSSKHYSSSYSNVSNPSINKSLAISEDFSVLDVTVYPVKPPDYCKKTSNDQYHPRESFPFSSTPIHIKSHPRSTFSVASLDTALLLQDTEALLNDMEKRVYSRKDKKNETSKSQTFSTNLLHGEKISFVDETEEKEDLTIEVIDNGKQNPSKCPQTIGFKEDNNISYTVRSPINSCGIRRNNSCKVGASESLSLSRKLNTNARNQRSCSMIEEQRQNPPICHTNSDILNEYRIKSKPSFLAMNSGIFVNRRGSAGFSTALNSPVSRLETGQFFNNNFSVQRSRDVFPYSSTNMLSAHRQRFNRFDYGQHSLKYNSNSTTMLYKKPNNLSPPWSGDDNIISPNTFYPSFIPEYCAYNTMPYFPDMSSNQLSRPDRVAMESINLNNDFNPEIDFSKKEDTSDFSQHCTVSGRASAFSPVNSLHQSSESINNNYQTTSNSKSLLGVNEQKHYSYDTILVSSVHQYSARLCRYTEEIVHRIRREGSEYQCNSPGDSVLDQSDTFGQLKSVNRELQETVSNLRALEKQLQKVERLLFPPEKSGRNSTVGNCNEYNYLNQLERINRELKDFIPINDLIINPDQTGEGVTQDSGFQANLQVDPIQVYSKENSDVKGVPSTPTCTLTSDDDLTTEIKIVYNSKRLKNLSD